MTSLILHTLDLFRKAFTAFGVDYDQLRLLVEVRLIMDNRRHVIGFHRRTRKESTNTFFITVLVYMMFGGIVGVMIMAWPSLTLSMLFFFSYLMMMITMTLITDFSSVLLDTSDNTILLPRPVEGRTLFTARVIHVFAYIGQLAFALSVVPFIVVVVNFQAVVVLVFVAAIVLSVLFSLALTYSLYLLILRFISQEKLKNIINYLQIAMTVIIMGGYQLGPRTMTQMEEKSFDIDRWSIFIPPAWMSATIEAFQVGKWDGLHIALTAIAFGVPVTGAYLVNKYLAPVFSKKLSALEFDTSPAQTPRGVPGRTGYANRMSRWLTVSSVEKSAFELVYKVLGRDRKFKLKIYPAFGYLVVLAIVFIYGSASAFGPTDHFHLSMIYLTVLVLQVAIREVQYSDEYRASWVFFSAPVSRPGEILSGSLKAILVRFFIPAYLLSSVVVLYVWGISPGIGIDLLFGFLNNCLMLLVLAFIQDNYIPFSLPPNARSQSGTFVRTLLITAFMLGLGYVHYLLEQWSTILLACVPIQLVLIHLLFRLYRSTSWSDIKN